MKPRELSRSLLTLLLVGVLAPIEETTGAGALEVVAVLRDDNALTGAHDIEIRDGMAFVAGKGFTSRALPRNGVFPYERGKGGSLAIVDVRLPAAPKVIWSADRPLAYEDAETVLPLGGGRWLVGTRDVFLFDVSRPSHPREIAAIKDRPTVDTINGFARYGDTVFAANKLGQVFAVDVSKPDQIKLIGARETRERGELGWPHDVAFRGDLLLVVSPEGFGRDSKPGRFCVYRVMDAMTHQPLPPEQWTLVGRIEHPRLAGANRVVARGRFAYVGSSLSSSDERRDNLRNNVAVVDLADPAQPALRGSVDFPDSRGPNGLTVSDRVAFAAGGQTVQAIDISDPMSPVELGHLRAAEAFRGGADDAHDLVYVDGHLFVTAQNSHSLVVLRVDSDVVAHRHR